MKEIKLKIECQSCSGTGVYSGMGETLGAAIMCYVCKGTGCEYYSFKYKDFKKIVKSKFNIKRVYLDGYGYCISPNPITLENGVFVDFSKEGVSYKEFLEGKRPQHIKHMACPMRADQRACHDIKGFTEECNKINGGWLSHIPSCKCENKAECWERFEKKEGVLK